VLRNRGCYSLKAQQHRCIKISLHYFDALKLDCGMHCRHHHSCLRCLCSKSYFYLDYDSHKLMLACYLILRHSTYYRLLLGKLRLLCLLVLFLSSLSEKVYLFYLSLMELHLSFVFKKSTHRGNIPQKVSKH